VQGIRFSNYLKTLAFSRHRWVCRARIRDNSLYFSLLAGNGETETGSLETACSSEESANHRFRRNRSRIDPRTVYPMRTLWYRQRRRPPNPAPGSAEWQAKQNREVAARCRTVLESVILQARGYRGVCRSNMDGPSYQRALSQLERRS